jgi:hypothetical protein
MLVPIIDGRYYARSTYRFRQAKSDGRLDPMFFIGEASGCHRAIARYWLEISMISTCSPTRIRLTPDTFTGLRLISTDFFGYFLRLKRVTAARVVRHDLHLRETKQLH